MSYNLRIIQEYFQPKIGRKIRIFSLGRKKNILIKKKSWVGFWVRKDINLMELRVICRVDSNAGVRTSAFLLILHGSEKMLTYKLHSPPKQYTF